MVTREVKVILKTNTKYVSSRSTGNFQFDFSIWRITISRFGYPLLLANIRVPDRTLAQMSNVVCFENVAQIYFIMKEKSTFEMRPMTGQ